MGLGWNFRRVSAEHKEAPRRFRVTKSETYQHSFNLFRSLSCAVIMCQHTKTCRCCGSDTEEVTSCGCISQIAQRVDECEKCPLAASSSPGPPRQAPSHSPNFEISIPATTATIQPDTAGSDAPSSPRSPPPVHFWSPSLTPLSTPLSSPPSTPPPSTSPSPPPSPPRSPPQSSVPIPTNTDSNRLIPCRCLVDEDSDAQPLGP